MSNALQIARLPRPFDPALGEETRAALPQVNGELSDLIAGAGGSSPYLKGLIEREADWLEGALDDPDAAVAALFDTCRALPPDQLKPGLRQAKRRVALITALADLSGAWPLERVTGLLTDFAGLACDLALKSEIATLIRRKKLPGMTGDDVATAAGLTVLAMGKMGAHELNYSSDIDLICLFDETRYDPDTYQEARHALVRATRNMAAALSDKTGDGYVFRTDLRLRPDPSVTPVCISMAAAETYYESLGRTWERAAYIKARPCAGDLEAGARFLQVLRPFVWRKHLDFAAIQDAHDMRLRIRESKGTGGRITVPGHDMKLGRGGIREIEFFTQTQQLIAGGRDPELRLRGTVEGLAALARKEWIPQDLADTLSTHYRAHREVEHRIQMVHDAQTHKVPKTEDGIARVACLMGMDSAALTADLARRLDEVHERTEAFFAPDVAPRHHLRRAPGRGAVRCLGAGPLARLSGAAIRARTAYLRAAQARDPAPPCSHRETGGGAAGAGRVPVGAAGGGTAVLAVRRQPAAHRPAGRYRGHLACAGQPPVAQRRRVRRGDRRRFLRRLAG